MKALQEIGIRKAIRFLSGQFFSAALCLCVLPQIRVILLKLLGARIGPDTIVHNIQFMNFYRGSFRNLTMGERCFIGPGCLLDLGAPIVLHDDVTFGPRVCVMTHLNVGYSSHPLQAEFPPQEAGVEIGAGSFVGASSTVLSGATIAPGCFVAAGALVHQSTESGTLVGGVPAKLIRRLEQGSADAPCTNGEAS